MRTPGFIIPPEGGSMDDVKRILDKQAEDYGFTPFDPEAFMEEVIQHHGVKGQKWGVVRKTAKLVGPSEDHVKSSVVRGKATIIGVHALSNKDLEKVIKRMDLEVKFKHLKTVQHNQSLLGKGLNWAGRVATDILVSTVSSWFKAPWSHGSSAPHHSGHTGRVIEGSIVLPRSIEPGK